MKNQKGFSAIYVVLIITIVGIIGFTGWYVYNTQRNNNKMSDTVSGVTPVKHKKPTSTVSTGEELADWRTYSNSKYTSFSFKYPQNVEINSSAAKTDFLLSVLISPFSELDSNGINGYDKQNILLDYERLKDGDPSVGFAMCEPSSYEILNLPNGIGKKFTCLKSMSVGNETFIRRAHFYKDNCFIQLIYHVRDINRVKTANTKYFIQDEKECVGNCYRIKNEESFKLLYKALLSGDTDAFSQQWFKDFDKILNTFEFN